MTIGVKWFVIGADVKVVEWAVRAGRKRQSRVTGFVHHCSEAPEKSAEVIPIYENFCFALALLRSKTVDQMLEAKALLQRLIAFRVGGQFPVYLHDYPNCRYAGLGSKLYPVVYFILRDFQAVIGDELRQELQQLLQGWSPSTKSVDTPDGLGEFLVQSQITGDDPTPAFKMWDCQALTYVGPQRQEGREPALTLYDLFMGEWGGRFSSRATLDHPVHLRGALIYPGTAHVSTAAPTLDRTYWGDGDPTHSLVLETSGRLEGDTIYLAEGEVHDSVEVAYYCNHHPDNEIWVDGQKSTTFQPGQTIRIGQAIELSFNIEGDGVYWGHIYRGNRAGQLSCVGIHQHEAFDWVIGVRTVKRSLSSTLRILYKKIDDSRPTERSPFSGRD